MAPIKSLFPGKFLKPQDRVKKRFFHENSPFVNGREIGVFAGKKSHNIQFKHKGFRRRTRQTIHFTFDLTLTRGEKLNNIKKQCFTKRVPDPGCARQVWQPTDNSVPSSPLLWPGESSSGAEFSERPLSVTDRFFSLTNGSRHRGRLSAALSAQPRRHAARGTTNATA